MNENGNTGSSCAGLSFVWSVLVSRCPSASRNSNCHGFSEIVTRPGRAVVAVAAGNAREFPGALVPRRVRRQASVAGSSAPTCGPVRRRIRTVRGDTNWMEKGSAGLMAYSPSGKVTPSKGRNTFSMLCEGNPRGKLMACPRDCLHHPGRRVKARQLVGQEVGVPVFVEIRADIHQVLQQTGRPVDLSLQARAPKRARRRTAGRERRRLLVTRVLRRVA